MIGNTKELYIYLKQQFPSFKEHWESYDNCFIEDDGSYTYGGMCAEFSHYYDDNFTSLDERGKKGFFSEIERELEVDKNEDVHSELSYAYKRFFLENISQTKAGEESKKWMGKLSREFFDKWHVYP